MIVGKPTFGETTAVLTLKFKMHCMSLNRNDHTKNINIEPKTRPFWGRVVQHAHGIFRLSYEATKGEDVQHIRTDFEIELEPYLKPLL